MSIQPVSPSFAEAMSAKLSKTDLPSCYFQEVAELCSQILGSGNKSLTQLTQLKSKSITAIGTTDQVVVYLSRLIEKPCSVGKGFHKQCNFSWFISFETNSNPLTPNSVTAENSVVLKPIKGTASKKLMSIYKEGKLGKKWNGIDGIVQTLFFGIYESKSRQEPSRAPTMKPLIVLERCGPDFCKIAEELRINPRSIPLEKLVDWCRQMIQTVANLHTHVSGGFHRDIKIDNIYLKNEDGTLRLGDLGTAQEKSYKSSFVGTISYISPGYFSAHFRSQQITPEILEANDIWALGCTIFALFTQTLPIFLDLDELRAKDSSQQLFLFYQQRKKEMISQLDPYPGINRIVKKMLVIPPNKPVTALEVLEEFNQLFPK